MMENANLSRRSLVQAIAGLVATAVTPLGWADVAQGMDEARGAVQGGAAAKLALLSAAEAADVEAVAAQIIPTDDSPGAREAGVVYFIDRALATFYAQLAGDYRAQLAAFQTAYRERHPAARSFGSLTSEQQVNCLRGIDETPFFQMTRLLTLLGMFALPEYGGNRDGVGWTLIGFEDRHVFRPPFGFYDRDYPGFVIDPVKIK
jgi:gluconate 2-dehydrogenase gamma chain